VLFRSRVQDQAAGSVPVVADLAASGFVLAHMLIAEQAEVGHGGSVPRFGPGWRPLQVSTSRCAFDAASPDELLRCNLLASTNAGGLYGYYIAWRLRLQCYSL